MMRVMSLDTPGGLGTMAWPTLMVLVSLAAPASPYMSSHCYFNPLCTCKLQAATAGPGLYNSTESSSPLNAIQSLMQAPADIRDVSCLGVPFARIPGNFVFSITRQMTYRPCVSRVTCQGQVSRDIEVNCFLGLLIL